ncbi:MAG: hypothetical protein LBJ96_05530 [Holosporaceae bacterium]|nr:hypothetical protein [Holosporaceae bacterium]
MYILLIKRFLTNILCALIPSKNLRSEIRKLFLFPPIKYNFQKNCVSAVIPEDSPIVNIAFCFDENFYPQARDSVISLLYNSADKCHYNIYCVVDQKCDYMIYAAAVTDWVIVKVFLYK